MRELLKDPWFDELNKEMLSGNIDGSNATTGVTSKEDALLLKSLERFIQHSKNINKSRKLLNYGLMKEDKD